MVCHLDRTDKDEHIEYQFPDIALHHRDRRRIGVDDWRGCRKHRKDNAGKDRKKELPHGQPEKHAFRIIADFLILAYATSQTQACLHLATARGSNTPPLCNK